MPILQLGALSWNAYKKVHSWFQNRIWQQQRMVDLNVLWPECKKISPDIDTARKVFAIHAFNDDAWIEFYGMAPLANFIEKLE